MFTGIIEEIGLVERLDLDDPLESLIIAAEIVIGDASLGDSIAVNGTCLTITRIGVGNFAVGVMAETLRRTNLGTLNPGDAVNLERPLRPDSRLGGHFVQGHIDGVGTITSVSPDGNALALRIETTPEILRYVVEKGFITVDGASLTVTMIDAGGFGVALIPYTQQHIAAGSQLSGRQVNIEVDVLAKYVEKLVIH